METNTQLTAYSYKANNQESYHALVEYATKMVAAQKLTLIPFELTIIVEPKDTSATIATIGKFIDDNALDFHIEPVDDTDDRDNIIAEITEKLTTAERSMTIHQEEATRYKKYWLDGATENSRIKEQVNAIAVLMAGIFPKS